MNLSAACSRSPAAAGGRLLQLARSVATLSGMGDFDKKHEGEGSKTADKQYREGATEYAKRTDTLQTGLAAERDVEANKADYEKAEKLGRAHGTKDLPADLAGKEFGKK